MGVRLMPMLAGGVRSMEKEPSFMPRPVAAVMPHLGEIGDKYPTYRRTQAPDAAIRSAIVAVMGNGPDVAEVLAFLRGDLDGQFGAGSGAKLGAMLLDQMAKEAELDQEEAAFLDRERRRERMDVVDLAESLATDRMITLLFREAFEERNEQKRDGLLDDVAGQIGHRAGQARTRTGRAVKMKQARAVVELLERKAHAAPGNAAAEDQFLWCVALGYRLGTDSR